MVNIRRLLKHVLADPFARQRAFPPPVLQRIEAAVQAAERGHSGELRVVIETSLPLRSVLRGVSARDRAIEVFSLLRVWDTEANSGVLIYLLLAERDLEIVVDRGIAAQVPQAAWDAIARQMEAAFAAGAFEHGACAGIARIGEILAAQVSTTAHNPDELPNPPVLL